jgi:hypothetical protein
VQQENRRRIFRAGLAVKDRETIDLNGAIRSAVFHGMFLSLGPSRELKYCEDHKKRQSQAQELQASVRAGSLRWDVRHNSSPGEAPLSLLK